MFSFFKKSTPQTVQINDGEHTMVAQPKETILTAALDAKVPFPNGCKVGSCTKCKCQLTSGSVKELTDTSFVLSKEELDAGYILACQAIPKTDVSITVDTSGLASGVEATITSVTRLTDEIVELCVQCDVSIDYVAGQYANLGFMDSPDIHRSYSFAAPPSPMGSVRFIIRDISGGALSPRLTDASSVRGRVQLSNPAGTFHLRKDDAPLLFVAGGSGLAPVLAILEHAASTKDKRPVTVLFGARTQQDIYAIEQLENLAKSWPTDFTTIMVLSDEPEESNWSGPRGYVGEQIRVHASKEHHAYLCGPPVMIDHCSETLADIGIDQGNIFSDRFSNAAEQ